MIDIQSEGEKVSKETLEYIHNNKTGKLLTLPIRFGYMLADAPEEDQKRMEAFSKKIGLAFQIVDDILDIEGSMEDMGKTIGKDSKAKKATFPAVYGLEKSKQMAEKLVNEAKNLLEPYGEKAELLLMLCDFIHTRKF